MDLRGRRPENDKARRQGLPTRTESGPATRMYACRYVGGVGGPLTPQQPYWFGVRRDRFEWWTVDGALATTLPFVYVSDAVTWGIGPITHDPGLRVVGFGPAGLAAGLLTAMFLRRRNTRTYMDSHLRVMAGGLEATFSFVDVAPQVIELALAPYRVHRRV